MFCVRNNELRVQLKSFSDRRKGVKYQNKLQIAISNSWGKEVSKRVQEMLKLPLRGCNWFEKEGHFNKNLCNTVIRAVGICKKYNLSILKIMFDSMYRRKSCINIKKLTPDGISDSCKALLKHRSPENDYLLKLLLKPF